MGRPFLLMEITTENIVHALVMLPTGSKAVCQVTEFESEKKYQITHSIAKMLLEGAIIDVEEYMNIDTILLAKYHPFLSTLLLGKTLK